MEMNRYVQHGPMMKSVLIYNFMKEKLMTGQLEFGEKILVNELIDEFKVSRRPVMDAMKMLEHDGFIEIIPQSGCKVIDYQRKVALDQFLLSSALEQLCAELAAINYTPNQMDLLENYQNGIKTNGEKLKDKFFFFNYNREFHFHILSMAHSMRISKITMQVTDLTDFFLVNLFEHFNFNIFEQVDYHSRIMEAIKVRDAKTARKLMEEHTSYINYLSEQLP